jgi:putative DNA primase/helicase
MKTDTANETIETFEQFAEQAGLGDDSPEGLKQAQYDRTIARYGSPFIVNAKGEPTALNPFFAPGVYADRSHILHDRSTRDFFEYDCTTGLWQSLSSDTMRGRLAELILEIGRDFRTANICAKERSDSKLAGTLNNLRAICDSSFDARPGGFIHCKNGMLEVATGELRPFAPDYLSRNASPIAWDPDATCPRFSRELLGSALGLDDICLLQRYAGLALLGRNLSQKMLLLTGTPGGGKSQLCKVIEGIVGKANVTQLRTHLLCERFEIARLVGKTLLAARDVPGNFLQTKGAHVLKALTGGDSLTSENKGNMRNDTIEGEFCVVITSNSRLRVHLDGDAGAWRRRLLLVKYEQPKTETPVSDFGDKLLATEGAGILRWAVDGAKDLLARDYQFPVTAGQQARVDSLLDESNALATFARTAIERAPGHDLTTAEIVHSFFEFCDKQGWASGSVGDAERGLPDLMMEFHRAAKSSSINRDGKSSKGYRGVKMAENG